MVKRPSDIIMVMDAAQIANEGLSDPTLTGTWDADADLWAIQGGSYQSNLLAYQSKGYPSFLAYEIHLVGPNPDAGLNQDWLSYSQMTGAQVRTPFPSNGNDLRFRHKGNTQANALFFDGHVDSFTYKHPGTGGSDLQWKNFILDDYRWGDIKWNTTSGHPT